MKGRAGDRLRPTHTSEHQPLDTRALLFHHLPPGRPSSAVRSKKNNVRCAQPTSAVLFLQLSKPTTTTPGLLKAIKLFIRSAHLLEKGFAYAASRDRAHNKQYPELPHFSCFSASKNSFPVTRDSPGCSGKQWNHIHEYLNALQIAEQYWKTYVFLLQGIVASQHPAKSKHCPASPDSY